MLGVSDKVINKIYLKNEKGEESFEVNQILEIE